MIRTQTILVCDSCGRLASSGCSDYMSTQTTREANAVAAAREEGWTRAWFGQALKDFCKNCNPIH